MRSLAVFRGALLATVLSVAACSRARHHAPDHYAVRTIADTPICASCTIVLDSVVTLGNPSDAELLRDLTTIVASPTAYYAVNIGASTILHYSSDGKFLGTLGREGDGPGEIRNLMNVYSDADGNIYATRMDEGSVEFPVGSKPVSFRVHRRCSAVSTPTILCVGSWAAHLDHGPPFHVLTGPTGAAHTFGPVRYDPAWPGRKCPMCRAVVTSPSHDSAFWAMDDSLYRLQRWTYSGAKLDEFELKPDGSTAPVAATVVPDKVGWKLSWRSVAVDSTGRLTVVRVVDTNTKRSNEPVLIATESGPVAAPSMSVDSIKARSVTFVDVIDPHRGLIATAAFPQIVLRSIGRGRYVDLETDTAGVVRAVIRRISLQGRR